MNQIELRLKRGSPQCKAMEAVLAQGIDAHLTAVTHGKFEWNGPDLACTIHADDLKVIRRRLHDMRGVKGSRALLKRINEEFVASDKLDEFTQAYVEAMLWDSQDEQGDQLLQNYGAADLHPSARKLCVEDCARFQNENAEDLRAVDYGEHRAGLYGQLSCAGHDFWLSRVGAGVGFFDRGLEEDIADRLQKAAEAFGPRYAYAEKGKVYID